MARPTGGAVSRGKSVNKTELADVFGVTAPTVDGWVKAGCPIVSRGSKGVASIFNTADVAKWLRDKARDEGEGTSKADEGELKRRKLAAETAKAELELAKLMGDVAMVREFERATASLMAAIRANMRNVPGRAVLQLLGCTDEMIFKDKLMEEIDLALVTAAETDVDLDDEDDEEGGTDG